MKTAPLTRRHGRLVAATAAMAIAGLAGTAIDSSVAPAVASTGAPAASVDTGLSVNGASLMFESSSDRNRDLDAIRESGAAWLRIDINASQITWAGPNQFDWTPLDAVVQGAQDRGLKVLGQIGQLPVYARPTGSSWTHGPATDNERAAFASFASKAATHYAHRVQAWEIWGTPNEAWSWAPAPNLADYATLLKVTAPAIRAADPSATILTGGTGYAPKGSGLDSAEWIDGLYSHGADSSFDAVGIHAYPSMANDDIGELRRADEFHAVLAKHGDQAKKVWVTQTGVNTAGGDATPQKAAALLTTSIAAWARSTNPGPIFVSTLRDANSNTTEGSYGLMTENWTAKSTYTAFQNLNSSMTSSAETVQSASAAPVPIASTSATSTAIATPATSTSPTATSSAPTAAAPTTSAVAPGRVDTSTANSTVGFSVPGQQLIFVNDATRQLELDRIAASGGTWLRVDVSGAQLVNPTYQEWSGLDATVTEARSRGIKVLGCISILPNGQRPDGAPVYYGPATDQDRSNFAAFAATAATRYKGQISAWEIWNEPNLTSHWYPAPNEDSYVKLLNVTSSTIRSIDPSATILSGSTGGITPGLTTDIWANPWIQGLYDRGARNSFDAVGIHTFTAPWQTPPDLGEMLPYYLNQYRATVDKNGDTNKQIWSTETGTYTGGAPYANETMASQFTVESLNNWLDIHDHGPMLYYTLNDGTGTDIESHFGFFRADGSAKPQYTALQRRLGR